MWAACSPDPPHEARECLEGNLQGREEGRKEARGGSHGAAELPGEEKTQKQLILLAELFL